MTPNDFIVTVQTTLSKAQECELECLTRKYDDNPPLGQVNEIIDKYQDLKRIIFDHAFRERN